MNENSSRPYPPLQFVAVTILLAAIVTFIAWSNFVEGQRAVKRTGSDYENMLAASLSMKFYYAFSEFGRSRMDLDQQSDREINNMRDRAIQAFKAGAGVKPSASNLRPLIVAAYRQDKPRYISQLVTVLDTSKSARAEAAMWKGIYVTPKRPDVKDLQQYSSTVDKLGLGWYGHLVKADLYEKAGNTEQAAEERQKALNAISPSVLGSIVLMFAFFIMFFVGLVLGVTYIVRKVKGCPSCPIEVTSMNPVQKAQVSGVLLEAFLVYLVVFLLIHYAILPLFITKKLLHNIQLIIILETVASTAWGIIALVYLHARIVSAGLSWKDIGLKMHSVGREVVWGLGTYTAAIPLMTVAGLLSRVIFRHVHTPSNQIIPLLIKSQNLWEKIAIFFLISIAAPFIEETFFRGTLFTGLRARFGCCAAVIVSAVVFALMHPLPSSFLPIFALGAVFAIVCNQRGSLIPGMVAHCINNTVAFVILILVTAGD